MRELQMPKTPWWEGRVKDPRYLALGSDTKYVLLMPSPHPTTSLGLLGVIQRKPTEVQGDIAELPC